MKSLRHVSELFALTLVASLALPALIEAQEAGSSAGNAGEQEKAATPASETDATAAPLSSPQEQEGESAKPKPKPKLVIGELTKELGRVQRGERVEIIFELANEGEAMLQIKGAEPSCGCTVTSYDRQIAPGATGRVTAKMDTTLLEGAVLKSVTVLTNDPVLPKVQLLIRAEIVSFVTVSPSYARLLQVQGTASATTAVNLWAEDGTPLEVGPIETGVDWIEAGARKAEPTELREGGPEAQWRVEISIHPDAPLGPLTETLILTTAHPQQPSVKLPLSGFVRPVLATTPAAADFGALAKNTDQRRFVLKLFNFGKPAVAVTSAATDLAFVSATIDPDEPGRRYKIRLQLAEDAPKGKFEGTLRIESDSELMPVLEVPVRGKVR